MTYVYDHLIYLYFKALKTPAAFAEQRKSLERAKVGLK